VKPLLNSKAVCEILGIKAPTLSRMVHSNRIPFILLGTGKKKLTVRFREEELEAWLDRRSRGPAPRTRTNGEIREDRKTKRGPEPAHLLEGSKGQL
jgi:excisionase family DNA binding protein